MIESGNLFSDIPEQLTEEWFEPLVRERTVRIERIVSRGQSTATGFWYDQEDREWVLLLKGTATIRFADGRSINLRPGDYLLIPSHERHRVEKTDPTAETIWLAVHFSEGSTVPRHNSPVFKKISVAK
ncbi:MAG: cupin domain-containing protein [Deltaproteobacteria bacterium]|nr:cupin domain-containing protein [Deltaproteobacteria bacterium]